MPSTRAALVSPGRGPWQLAVFDIDGTLVDTRRDLLEALEEAFSPGAFDSAARERAAAMLHLGMRAMAAAALGGEAEDPERIGELDARYAAAYSARIARHSRLYPGVWDTLNWLAERGVRMAVCSNKPRDLSRLLLRRLALDEFFPHIVGPDSTGWAKPHPEPLRRAAHQSGVECADAVLIGDSIVDLQCAEAAGAQCWIFAGGYDQAVHSRAPVVFERFSELRHSELWTGPDSSSRGVHP